MGKSGKINRVDPSDLTWVQKLPDCAEMFQQGSKSKRKAFVKPVSSSQPAGTEKSQLAKESCQPAPKLSEIIFEIRDKIIKQQEEAKAKTYALEKQEWDEEDEAILKQAGIIEESVVQVDFSDLLMQEPNVLENPSDEESLQGRVQKYKQ